MPNYDTRVPRLKDRDIFKFFYEASIVIGAANFNITEIGGERISYKTNGPDDASRKYLESSNLYTVFRANCSAAGCSLNLAHDGADPFTDQFQFNVSDGVERPPADIVRAVNQLASETFMSGKQIPLEMLGKSKSAADIIQSHQKMLVQLQSTATNVTEQLTAARIRLEEEFAERQTKLEQEYQARQTQSESTAEELRRSILNREEELQQRTKELDDRDHIHARRQLREQITANIADRLKGAIVPPRTSLVGWFVFWLTLAGAGFLGWISYISLQEFSDAIKVAASISPNTPATDSQSAAMAIVQSSAMWILLARGALAGAGAVAFLVYAISWLKSIYQADVKAQRDLERYSIDLNRASWAVETIMEAKADGGAIPDILVAGVSRNLFEGSTPERGTSGATADALGSLLRASAKAKIGPSGAEFELNSRGANKIANQLED